MGLDVGVIREIDYLERPTEEVRNFIVSTLLDSPFCSCCSEGNALVFAFENQVKAVAKEWEDEAQREKILQWIDSLPWENNYIRLYFNW